MRKLLILILPLSFMLLSDLSARGGGGGGHGGESGRATMGFGDRGMPGDRNANFDNYNNYRRNADSYNNGYYNGGYYGGYGGYGPVLAPDSTLTPNDDTNQIYQNNLNNMERTDQ